jgi:hypothetical protein
LNFSIINGTNIYIKTYVKSGLESTLTRDERIYFFLSYKHRIKKTRNDTVILHVTVSSTQRLIGTLHFLSGTWIFPKSLWRLVATPAPGPAAAVGAAAGAVGEFATASVMVSWLAGAAGVASPSAGHTPVPSTATVMVSAAATAMKAVAAAAAAAGAVAVVHSPSGG